MKILGKNIKQLKILKHSNCISTIILCEHIWDKLKRLSVEGRKKYTENNQRAKSYIDNIARSMERLLLDHEGRKGLRRLIGQAVQPCPPID